MFFANVSLAQNLQEEDLQNEKRFIEKVVLPKEVTSELKCVAIPDKLKDKVWNRWTSKNFVVLSLNDKQAQYLHKYLEYVKSWSLIRWGFYDIDFAAECKIICVDDPELFREGFGIENTYVDLKYKDGKLDKTIIYVLIDGDPAHTIPIPLTDVCVAEFSQKHSENFPFWFYRGSALLNGAIDQIKRGLMDFAPVIQDNHPMYFSEGLFSMTKEEYVKLDATKQRLYDQSAMLFCLLLRKEFGQDKLHWFIKKSIESGGETALREVLKFKSVDDFDRTFKTYLIDLVTDVKNNETPDDYLQIKEKSF